MEANLRQRIERAVKDKFDWLYDVFDDAELCSEMIVDLTLTLIQLERKETGREAI
jgi:hypothetical protein